MAIKYVVLGVEYNQKQLKEKIKKIINFDANVILIKKYGDKIEIKKEDNDFLLDCIDRYHPDYKGFKNEIDRIMLYKNNINHINVWVEFKDGIRSRNIGKDTIVGIKSDKLNKLCRWLIKPYVDNYKKEHFMCEECKNVFAEECHHVVSYKEVYKNFIIQIGTSNIPDETEYEDYLKVGDIRPGYRLLTGNSKAFAKEWVEYHNKKSILKNLCTECHNKTKRKIY